MFYSILLLVHLVASPSQTPSALEEVRENFRKYSAFEVSFEQEVQQELFVPKADKESKLPVAKGSLEFKRPHFLTWTYTEPAEEQKKIIYNGKQLKVVRGDEEELVTQTGGISLEESFSFLWGRSNSQLFITEASGPSSFVLKPRQPGQAQFQSIEVQVERGVVQEALVTDLLDGKSRLRFKNWRFESKAK